MTDEQLYVLRETMKLGEQADDGLVLAAGRKLLAEVDRLRAAVQQEREACAGDCGRGS